MIQAPCLKCDWETPERRSEDCHGSCKEYKKYRKELDKAKETKRGEYDYYGHMFDTMDRFKKRRNSIYHNDRP